MSSGATKGPVHVRLATCLVDLRQEKVFHDDGTVESLTTKEAELLAYLDRHAGRSVTQEELHREVWGYASHAATRAAYYTVRRLRAKLERDPAHPVHVLTAHGIGYRFEPWAPNRASAPTVRRTTNELAEIAPLTRPGDGLDRLGPCEREAFVQGSIFQGGFTLDAAECVIDLSAFEDAPPILDVLDALREARLLETYPPTPDAAEFRFRTAECARDEGSDPRSDSRAALERRYIDTFVRMAEDRVDPERICPDEAVLRWLASEADNLIFATHLALASGRLAALRLAVRTAPWLLHSGALDTLTELFDRALLPHFELKEPVLRARAYRFRAKAGSMRGAIDAAYADLQRGLELARQGDEPRVLAAVLHDLGALADSCGEVDAGEAFFREGTSIARLAVDRAMEAQILGDLGRALVHRGRLEDAETRTLEALAIHRELADAAGATQQLNQLELIRSLRRS